MAHSNRGILYNGRLLPSAGMVADGRTVPLRAGGVCFWQEPSPNIRARKNAIRAVLLHHTAGEGNGTAIFKTLQSRKLSVHFTIDREGVVTQHADLASVAYHAGPANSYTVGIEIASRGVAPSLPQAPRESYADRVHGVERLFLAFYKDQVTATRTLCRDLCDLLQLPFKFPTSEDGSVKRVLLTGSELSTWRGMLGHMHVSQKKVDPSPHIYEELLSE